MAKNEFPIRLETVESAASAVLKIKRTHLENLTSIETADSLDIVVSELANTALKKLSESIALHISYLNNIRSVVDTPDVRSFDGLDVATIEGLFSNAVSNYDAALNLVDITINQSKIQPSKNTK